MEEQIIPELSPFNPTKYIKTYLKRQKKTAKTSETAINKSIITETQELKSHPLTTKNAVKYLLEGTLKRKVCRYCLNVASPLSELDQVLQVAGKGAIYKVTIKDMLASFHPFKVTEDPNFPNKICEKCLEKVLGSYLFTQQCEQAERALRNCFDDMYDKLEKLDPLERLRKRGRQKLHPNHNILYTEHENVIDYAEPIINMVHTASEPLTKEDGIKDFECLKCCQVLPNLESLLNHEKSHPASMWYHCRLCGKSFPKRYQLRRHMSTHKTNKSIDKNEVNFTCNKCGDISRTLTKYLQHLEKHKFKTILEHLVERKMNRLCSICLEKSANMTDLDKEICLHGGYPELHGDRKLYNILGSTIPEMNVLHNYTGSKICEKCVNNSLTSYIFLHQSRCNRNRLDTCINLILEGLQKIVQPASNTIIEISPKIIMPITEETEEIVSTNEVDTDGFNCNVDVLEDEFRVQSDDEDNVQDNNTRASTSIEAERTVIPSNPALTVTKTYSKPNFVNGYQTTNSFDKVSEFLSFKKKKTLKKLNKYKFTCPLCNKHFISAYFLRGHLVKHINRKVECKSCGKSFKSKFILHEHVKMVHIFKRSNYKSCVTCGRCFVDQYKLALHKKHHRNKKCDLCDKIFRTQYHFDNHMQRHSVKLRTVTVKNIKTCNFCEKECYSENGLSLHVNKVHLQIKPYSCDMCDENFSTEYNLNCHKKIHSLRSKEICEFCKKTLKSRKLLVIHLRKHLGVTPHACQVCGISFHSQLKMINHLKALHGGKFICSYCKIAFVTKSKLKEHFTAVHSAI